ncbi:Lpg1974 family pore-forming outer membrane protein [Rhodopirellula sp. MGV]|uniref:Lpg1974 family pore-forming outer membrane protein n=1 Tax=Rhodopirellula sp. MGV TaxID=2023130 RepID=UPI000B95F633|nr:Lpg1974 family pore-forming outer membrane protein [Rhodopirellula sp. MGV]OYP38278.1 hypothetical protein CGZ80_03430 [Rhodopirellula sp. MGV]PNY38616.1 hypothetical protein C2E31_01485 [Rhodopirellula baltica]
MGLRYFLLGAVIAFAIGNHSASYGQEIELGSYDSLLDRVEKLEQNAAVPVHRTAPRSCYCDTAQKGFYGMGELVLVTPFQSNATGIIAQNDPVIEHLNFDWNMQDSYRVEFGYLGGTEGFGWRARYWQFDNSTSFDVDGSVGLVQDEGTIIWSSTNDGDTIIGLVDVDTATMTHSIEADVFDFELQRQLAKPLKISGGVRYAKIAQGYLADTDSGVAMADIEFEGVGPTLASELVMPVRNSGFSIFCNGRGSLLFGNQNFRAIDDGGAETLLIESDSHLASSVELQLGGEFRCARGLYFRTGLESQYWANVGSPNPSAIYADDSDEANVDDPQNEDLGFIGLMLEAGFVY